MSDLLILLLALIAYFLPSVVAGVRSHNNYNAILLLNLLLGWTVAGWIGALIWSATDNVEKREVKA